MSETRVVTFVSSGYGAEPMSATAFQKVHKHATANNLQMFIEEVQCTTFEEIVSDHVIIPDVIKIDIESYEFELIESSLKFLHQNKPRIMLELHVSIMKRRELDPKVPLDLLASIGYRRFRGRNRDLISLIDEADGSGVVRVGLVL
jgi:hypothetical protein